jgi:hypothetical protein
MIEPFAPVILSALTILTILNGSIRQTSCPYAFQDVHASQISVISRKRVSTKVEHPITERDACNTSSGTSKYEMHRTDALHTSSGLLRY